MRRFNRLWLGSLVISLGHRILPASVRGEWDLQFKRKTFPVPHPVDTRRFDA